MLKQDLIEEVQKDDYKHICKKLLPPYWEDLYQELVLIVLEYDEAKIEKIQNINGARYFLVGILCKMAHSNTSQFYTKYRKSYIEMDVSEPEEEADISALNVFDGLHWFKKDVFKSYVEEGSIRKVASKENINRGTVYNIVKEVKEAIHKQMNPIKVLLVTQNENNALKYHRQLSPNWRLAKCNSEFQFTTIKTDGAKSEASIDFITDEVLQGFDIVYYLRQISFAQGKVKDTVDRCHKLGCKVILDIDDYWRLNSEHLMAGHYKKYNVPEEVEQAIKQVDHVITTTDSFSDIIRNLNPNVTVLPNCISPDDDQFKPRQIESARVRFGWIGGVYHKADIEAIAENFCRVHKDKQLRDSYQICLGGYNYPNPEYQAIESSMTCNYEFKNFDATYASYLFTQTPTMEHISYDKSYRRLWARDVEHYGELYNEIDVAVIPLKPLKFNACKSELKLVEAGTMGKAVIVSDVEPYAKWIKDGVNGIKINPNRNNIDWWIAMKKLIREPQMRKDLADGLSATIKEHFDMDTHNKRRAELYRSLT